MKSLCADTDAPGFTTHLVQHLARERDSGLHRRTACSTCPRARARVRARARARARGVLQKTVQRYKRCPFPCCDPVPLSRYVRYGERNRRSSNGRESTYHVGITTHAAWANRRIPTPKAMGGATSRARWATARAQQHRGTVPHTHDNEQTSSTVTSAQDETHRDHSADTQRRTRRMDRRRHAGGASSRMARRRGDDGLPGAPGILGVLGRASEGSGGMGVTGWRAAA